MKLKFLAFPLIAALSACSGGEGSSSITPVPNQNTFAPVVYPLRNGVNDLLYVGNTGNNSITVYNHAANGNIKPTYVIAGSRTGISVPGQLSEDAASNLYVANGSSFKSSTNPAILVFAHGANGNVAPIRIIAGPSTGIQNVEAMTVDIITGNIYVTSSNPSTNEAGLIETLLVFGPNSNGNVAPLSRMFVHKVLTDAERKTANTNIETIEFLSIQLAVSISHNIIDAHAAACCASPFAGVETFSNQFQISNGYLTPIYSIDAFWPNGIAYDQTTKTYLASTINYSNGISSANGIYRFAETTNGYGADNYGGVPAAFTPPVVSVITSDTCAGQLATAWTGPTPYTYVIHSTLNNVCPTNGVYVYENNANGNARPVQILSGPATLMNQPYGIIEGI